MQTPHQPMPPLPSTKPPAASAINGANPFVGLIGSRWRPRWPLGGALIAAARGDVTVVGLTGEQLGVLPGTSDLAPDPRTGASSIRPGTARLAAHRPVLPRHARRRAGYGRRPQPRREERRPGPVRADAVDRGAGADERPGRQPRGDEAGCADAWHVAGPRHPAHALRPAPQRRHAVAGRHPAVQGRRQPGRHARRRRLPQRGDRADPVRAGHSDRCASGRC